MNITKVGHVMLTNNIDRQLVKRAKMKHSTLVFHLSFKAISKYHTITIQIQIKAASVQYFQIS